MRETPDIGFSTGAYVSGVAHAGLFLWLLIGGFFVARDNFEAVSATDVSLISAEEFAALQPRSPDTSNAPQAPEQPRIEEVVPAIQAEDVVETPEPPAAIEQTEPDAVPEQLPEELAPIELAPSVNDQPDAPVEGDVGATLISPETQITPERAPRVAPQAVPAPENDVRIDDVVTAPSAPAPDATTTEEAQDETAPEAATEEIVTEADQSFAPVKSSRPAARPNRPARPQVADTAPQDAPENDPVADSIAAAVAEANAAPATPATPSGPPLTGGEKEGFRLGIQKCWNVGALSTEALQVVVVVGFALSQDGRPSDLRLISAQGGSGSAVDRAFETARRAIIRCGVKGYDLPPEKYAQWKDVEVTFDATKGLIR